MRMTTTCLAFFASGSLLLAPAAFAKGSSPKPAAAQPAPKADAKAVAELMAPFKWGMSLDDVMKVIGDDLRARRAEAISKMSDIYAQNKARKDIEDEIARIKATYTEFKGQRSGWDVSLIETEFAQNDDESMLVFKDIDATAGKNEQRFFFFADGKLYKIFVAFDTSAYQGKTFDDFRKAMDARYGKSADDISLAPDGTRVSFAYWRGNGIYLRAIDEMQFFNDFCLALSDDSVDQALVARRAAKNPHPAVRGGTVSDGMGADIPRDPNGDVVNSIIGGGSNPPPPPTPPTPKK